jgi:hypothetical protein
MCDSMCEENKNKQGCDREEEVLLHPSEKKIEKRICVSGRNAAVISLMWAAEHARLQMIEDGG